MKPEQDENEIIAELEEEEIEDNIISEGDIVKKYDEGQARIMVQRNDFLIPNILQMVSDRNILNLSPKYQRRKRWDDSKRSHLIESLLMNIPIPPIFLYERDLAKYEVMDGQQRLDSIRAFVNNEFKLCHLTKWPELNNRTYSNLPSRIQAGLTRRGLSAVIILTESGQSLESAMEIRQYVFERLNTGGEKLNAQEIRNCIYASPFNDMLVELSRTKLFTSSWGIPPKEPDEPHKTSKALTKNRLYATMADCEIVLRFFTLSEMDYFKGGMKKALDDCMIRMKKLNKTECEKLKKKYITVLDVARDIYGDFLFKLPNKAGELQGRHSVPLSDAVLLGIAKLPSMKARQILKHSTGIISETKKLFQDENSYTKLVGRANTKTSIQERLDLIYGLFVTALKKG